MCFSNRPPPSLSPCISSEPSPLRELLHSFVFNVPLFIDNQQVGAGVEGDGIVDNCYFRYGVYYSYYYRLRTLQLTVFQHALFREDSLTGAGFPLSFYVSILFSRSRRGLSVRLSANAIAMKLRNSYLNSCRPLPNLSKPGIR